MVKDKQAYGPLGKMYIRCSFGLKKYFKTRFFAEIYCLSHKVTFRIGLVYDWAKITAKYAYFVVIFAKSHVNLLYSRVQKSWNEVFFKILKKPSIVQKKMIPHIKGLDFSQR